MDRIPILDVEKINAAPKNLTFVFLLDPESLPHVKSPQARFQFGEDFFARGPPQDFARPAPWPLARVCKLPDPWRRSACDETIKRLSVAGLRIR